MKNMLKVSCFLYVVFAIFVAYTSAQPKIAQRPPVDHSKYTVVIWTADACWGCVKYKRQEQPKLEELGYKIKIKDISKSDFDTAPTISLYYKDTLLRSEVYWSAKNIEKFVQNRSKLK